MTTVWLTAALGLLLALVPCALTCLRGKPIERLVGLEMAAVIQTLLLVCLAEAFERATFIDLALALGLLGFGNGLVFARFLERWL